MKYTVVPFRIRTRPTDRLAHAVVDALHGADEETDTGGGFVPLIIAQKFYGGQCHQSVGRVFSGGCHTEYEKVSYCWLPSAVESGLSSAIIAAVGFASKAFPMGPVCLSVTHTS